MSLVTNGNWCVSYVTGYDLDGNKIQGCRLEVFQVVSTKPYKIRYADHHGRLFANSDEASQFALERGYLKTHYRVDTYGWKGEKRPALYELHMRHGRELGVKKMAA